MKKSISLLILFLSSCSVGPKYTQPTIETAAHFINDPISGGSIDLSKWWQQFNDEELSTLIKEGCLHNFDMRVSLERVFRARALYVQDRGDFFPTVDAVGAVKRERFSQELFDSPFLGPPVQSFYQLGFDASWEIDLFGKVKNSVAAAKAEIGSAQEDLRDTYITATAEIAKTYFEFRALQHQVFNVKKQIELFKTEASLQEELYASGYINRAQLETTFGALATLRSELPVLEKDLNQSLYALAILVGKRPDELLYLLNTSSPLPSVKDPIPTMLPSELLQRRPDVRQAERNLAAATARIGVAVADLFPRVSLTGSFHQESSESSELFNTQAKAWNIGPSVRWPVLTFGRVRANIKVKTFEQKEAMDLYEKAVFSALQDVESSLTGYQNAEQTAAFQAQAVLAIEQKLSLINAQYDAGYISYIELLEIRRSSLGEERKLLEAVQRKLTGLVTLYKALGGDWECSSMP